MFSCSLALKLCLDLNIIEAGGLKQAEEKGIYEKAVKTVKTVIKNSLAAFSSYEVKFL